MEKEITDLFRQKSFAELNDKERAELSELCESEEEFEQMRNLFVGIEMLKTEKFEPKVETKSSLDALFAAQTKKQPVVWYNGMMVLLYPKNKPFHQRPFVQIAAAVILILLVLPFLTNDKMIQDQTKLAKTEVKTEKPFQLPTVKDSKEEASGSVAVAPKITSVVDEVSEVVKMENTEGQSGGKMDRAEQSYALAESTVMTVDALAQGVTSKAIAKNAEVDSRHPDGVFSGVEISYSKTLKQQPAVLDLLTAAF
jgi:hypothetical protein